MIEFLKSAFKVTWFQVILITSFSLLKYVANSYQLVDKFTWPLLWIGLAMALIFIVAVGITGIIEDKELGHNSTKSTTDRVLATVAGWAFAIPVITAFVMFICVLAPTSWQMAIALYSGIVIRNILDYWKHKEDLKSVVDQTETIN
jgi:TRAP-type C4-dicarboxylate transport system permease large subunit